MSHSSHLLILLLALIKCVVSNKQQSSITIALIGPYSWIPGLTYKNSLITGGYNRINITEMSDLTKWGYTSWWFFNQLSAEVAVARINSDPTILPNTTIRIKRFNNYCCNATQTRGSSAGQAAVVAQEIAEQHPDVAAVFGDFFTGTTLGDGQVFSQKQIPMCGATQHSPRLSNKSNFPYFVSALASSGYGPAIAALLKSWSVERVAILTTSTLKDTCLAIKSALKQSKIDVAVVVERVVSLDLEYVANIVDLAGARYIISCDTGEPLFDMYMTLATKTRRLVGPQYVWIALGLLSQGAGSPGSAASKYGPNYYKYAEGFVTVYGGTMSTPAMSQMQLGLLKSVNTFQANNGVPKSMRFSYSALTSRFNALASYDCVGLLVKGLDRVVNSRGATGMDDLVSGRLRGLLNYTAFRDTGYQGANADPFVLTEGGDMATPFIFYYADGKSESLVSLPFATTDISQTIITPLPNKTIHFNGGSFIPPRDRPEISETVLELTSNAGLSIITLMALGFLATTILATITYLYPQNAAIRASSPPFLYLLCISAVLAYTSLWFYIGVPTASRYITQICLESLALVILLSSMLVKNARMLVLYSLKVVLKRKWLFKDWFAVLVVTGFVAVEVVLVAWFMVLEAVDVTMTVFMVQETGMEVVEYGIAVSRAGKVVFAVMWVYHAVLVLGLLVLAFLTRNVATQHNEASLMVTVALSISVGSVIVYSSKDGTDYLDRVIASAGIVWVLATLPVLAQLIPKLLAVQAAKKIGGRSMLEAMLERASRKSSSGSSRNSAGVGKTTTPDGVAKTMPSLPRSSSQLPRLHEPTPSEPPPPLLSRRSTKNLLHTPLSPFPTSKRNDRGSISPSSGSTAKRDSSVFSNTFPISYSSKSSYFLRSPWHEGFIAIGKINKNRFVLLLPRRFDDIETPPVAFSIADTIDEGVVVELCDGVHRLTLRWTNVDLWIDFRSSVYAKQVLDLVMANSGTHESTENK
ncbi:periplasmic binding protein-like I [Rhizoclosmatium globosum]|uniref:Periplasmic binding protein-like I n=1 Tax=Rhizoclosmatium globosum TaxID=329046 RepID=A0A1Y2B4R1_9FUNG|nr:periplasmic binding protein-like I [Rhizoclosmatium globosum]|eukprot:ORY29724.1 periplasmic binding protein-like I [Rhizoclosmatium globosum]